MAKVVTDSKNTVSRAKYPWDQWADGREWEVTQGDDFKCSRIGFVAQVHLRASVRGMRAVTTSRGKVVRFRFISKPEIASTPEAVIDNRD